MTRPASFSASDRSQMTEFYQHMRAATLPGAGRGQKNLTHRQLRAADRLLRGASEQAHNAAWTDVLQVLAQRMPDAFVQRKQGQIAGAQVLCAQNGYVSYLAQHSLQAGGLVAPAVAAAEKLATRKVAIKLALARHLAPAQPALQRRLGQLIDRATKPQQLNFIAEGWPSVIQTDASGQISVVDKNLEYLVSRADGLKHGSQGPADARAVRKLLRPLQRSGGSDQPFVDEKHVIGGISGAELSAELASLKAEHGAGRLIYDADCMRIKSYKRKVEQIKANPTVQAIMPYVDEAMVREETAYRTEQTLTGALLITAPQVENGTARFGAQAYAKPLYDLTQEVGKELGFTKPVDLVIAPSLGPNAFVYTSNLEKPRMTFFTPMAEKFWDNRTNDWIKLWIGPDGKPAKPHSEGAELMDAGKLAIESVIAHELGHIRDQIITVHTALMIMFFALGQDLASRTSSPQEKQQIQQLMQHVEGRLGHCRHGDTHRQPGSHSPFGMHATQQGRLASQIFAGMRLAPEQLAQAEKMFRDLSGASTTQHGPSAGITMEDLVTFYKAVLKIGRAGEATADRYAVSLQGGALWTTVMDQVLGMDLQPSTSDQHKVDSLRRIVGTDPKAYAQEMVEIAAREQGKTVDLLDFDVFRTHPASATRILLEIMFDEDRKGLAHQLRELASKPPEQRLLATIQLYERQAAMTEADMPKRKAHNSLNPLGNMFQTARVSQAVAKKEEAMEPFMALVDRLVGDGGLLEEKNGMFDAGMHFIERRGFALGGKVPMQRLMTRWIGQLQTALSAPGITADAQAIGQGRLDRLQSLLRSQCPNAVKGSSDAMELSGLDDDSDSDFGVMDAETVDSGSESEEEMPPVDIHIGARGRRKASDQDPDGARGSKRRRVA